MTKIIYNISDNNYPLNVQNVNSIKLINATINNDYACVSSDKKNNKFHIKGISNGIPHNTDVLILPETLHTIIIPDNYYNKYTLIEEINTLLLANNFYKNNIGIYFELIDNIVSIKNKSYHYNCEIIFLDNLFDTIGFVNNTITSMANTTVYASKNIKLYDNFIFLSINNYNSLINNNTNLPLFGKLLYNNLLNIYYTDYHYECLIIEKKINNITINFFDSIYNKICINKWNIILEIIIIDKIGTQIINNVNNENISQSITNNIKFNNTIVNTAASTITRYIPENATIGSIPENATIGSITKNATIGSMISNTLLENKVQSNFTSKITSHSFLY